MEIERKYLISQLPEQLQSYPSRQLEQGYLCVNPVVRIRREDERYELTYKGKGFLMREEANFPLSEEAFLHLKEKVDGQIISKTRYVIPYLNYQIELDVFHGTLSPLVLAEVEFPDEAEANAFVPPEWFGEDVTFLPDYQNSTLSQISPTSAT